jgi:hypothetical protein
MIHAKVETYVGPCGYACGNLATNPLSFAVVPVRKVNAPDPALWKRLGTAVRNQREMKTRLHKGFL